METQFSDADIGGFISGLIELGGLYVVDKSPDKYIREKDSGKIAILTVDKRSIPLAVFGTKATDALIVNPFAEGEVDHDKHTWFFKNGNMILAGHVAALIYKILEVGAAAQKKTKGEKEPEDMAVVRTVSKHVLDVDEKMLKEFKSISKEIQNFMSIYYNKSTKQGELSCLIFKQAQRKPFTTVRVKTWDVLEGILEDLLGTKDMSDFIYRPTVAGAPYFESFANILVSVYEKINDKLQIIGKQIPPELLGGLRSHLKYFADYYSRAAWCSSPTPQAPVVAGQPTVISGSTIPFGPGISGAGTVPLGSNITSMPGISRVTDPQPVQPVQPLPPMGMMAPVGIMPAPVLAAPVMPAVMPMAGFGVQPMGVQPLAGISNMPGVSVGPRPAY